MNLKTLLTKAFDFLAWRAPECLPYDEVFGRPGDAAPRAAATPPPPRQVDADAYFKDVFSGSAL